MKNNNQIIEPQNKKSNDFMKLMIGIIVVIIALIAIKYLTNVLGLL